MPNYCDYFATNPACIAGNAAAGLAGGAAGLAGSFFEKLAKDVAEAAVKFLAWSMTWWTDTDSVNPDSTAVHNLQSYTIPIVVVMLVGSVFNQAIRMMITRRKDPGLNVALGLMRYAVVTTVALGLLAATLKAGDEYSEWLIGIGTQGFVDKMTLALRVDPSGQGVFMTFLLGLIALLLSLVQWVLFFFRQAGILVLASLIPLAVSGSINESTKPWFDRMVPWLIALVLYKPIAAIIYALGFTLMGDGQDFSTVMTGLVVLVLAVVAMPSMMRFFSWSQTAVTAGSGTGGAVAGAATGAASLAALQSSRGIDNNGPGTGPRAEGSSPGSAGSSPPSPGGGSGGAPGGSRALPPGGGTTAAPSPPGPGPGGGGVVGGSPGPAGPAGASGGPPVQAAAGGGGAAASGAGGGAAAAAGPAGAAAAGAAEAARLASGAAKEATDAFTPPGADS